MPTREQTINDAICVDGVVHVHKAAVTEVCELDGRLTRLMDVADFIKAASSW